MLVAALPPGKVEIIGFKTDSKCGLQEWKEFELFNFKVLFFRFLTVCFCMCLCTSMCM